MCVCVMVSSSGPSVACRREGGENVKAEEELQDRPSTRYTLRISSGGGSWCRYI